MGLPATNTDPAASCTWGQSPKEVKAPISISIERNLPREAPKWHPTQCTKLKELGQCPEAGKGLSNRADSLQLAVRLMPSFTAWQKMSTVCSSIISAWRGLIPSRHTRGAAKWQQNTNHRRACTNYAKGRGKKNIEKQHLFIQEYELVCKVSYTGLHCTEPWQLVKIGTEQSHTSQPVLAMSLCPDLRAAFGYLLFHPLAMPSSSAGGLAVLRTLPSPSWPICFISLVLWDEGRRLQLNLRSSQYFATGNCACYNTALNQQLNQWYFIFFKKLTIWYLNGKN